MKLLECYITEPRFPAFPLEKNRNGEPVQVLYDVVMRYEDAPGGVPAVWRGEVSNRAAATGKNRYKAAETLKRMRDCFGFSALDGLAALERRFYIEANGCISVALP